jgi:hypothetical protein
VSCIAEQRRDKRFLAYDVEQVAWLAGTASDLHSNVYEFRPRQDWPGAYFSWLSSVSPGDCAESPLK